MRKKLLVVLTLCLAASVLLGGCGIFDAYFTDIGDKLSGRGTAFADMEYTRPDMDDLFDRLDAVTTAAKGVSVDRLIDKVDDFYTAYHDFYTAYSLANIHYSADLTDTYWEAEYEFCLEQSTDVDAGIDQMFYILADSRHREALEADDYFGEGFFDDYQGDSIWDEAFTELMSQEAQLQNEYYDLRTQSLECGDDYERYYNEYGTQMAELFARLVALRQEIADYAGYDSYPEFAYDFYHLRDYTPDQERAFLQQIRQKLVPLYRRLGQSDVWSLGNEYSTERETHNYVATCAEAMGGTVARAYAMMERAGLYDISYGANKYDASFTVYLMSYNESFIFLNPTMSVYDQLTFAHEFGHFCNDYASDGSMAGVDVAEIFSQGMEYLSLFYGKDTEDLEKLKMADSLSVYVEQAAYADFEQRAYALEGDALNTQSVCDLFERICQEYGLDMWDVDCRGFVDITHFFTNPMYVFSYVVSNDAAMQLYQMEKEEAGSGLELYQKSLSTVEETGFLAFLEAAGLESPFADGRIDAVRDTFEQFLDS